MEKCFTVAFGKGPDVWLRTMLAVYMYHQQLLMTAHSGFHYPGASSVLTHLTITPHG